jgi:hypothetical protein
MADAFEFMMRISVERAPSWRNEVTTDWYVEHLHRRGSDGWSADN